MVTIELEQRIAASPQAVWAILADHEGMPRWMPVREVVRRSAGAPDPDGVGAVRTVRTSGLVFDERVTAFEPAARLEYELTAGAPIRDHAGAVTLVPSDGGTLVRWTVRFRPLLPGTGWLLRRSVARMLQRGLEGLRRRAEAG